MNFWRVPLRKRETGWTWECRDASGNSVCRSIQLFASRSDALLNFDSYFRDQIAILSGRLGLTATRGAGWVCEH